MGPCELQDILETMGQYVDIYKFSGGSFALMLEEAERLGFDIVELSSGFLVIGTDDMVRMTEIVAEDCESTRSRRSTFSSELAALPI
nr:phosphosulfolactate synthase [Natrinema sp. CBA1119]